MTPQYKRVLLKLSGEMLGKGGKVSIGRVLAQYRGTYKAVA